VTGEILLRTNAVVDVLLAVVFLLAPWDGLYEALDLPQASPALYAQALGAVLLAFAYALWLAPREDAYARSVAFAAALGHVVGGFVLLGWALFGALGIGTIGKVELVAAALAGFVLGTQELRLALRRVAIVLPQD
jgi:hypothetical protein